MVAVLHRPGSGPLQQRGAHAPPAVLGPDAHLVEVALPVDDGDHRVAHDLLAEHRHPDRAALLVAPERGEVVGRRGGDLVEADLGEEPAGGHLDVLARHQLDVVAWWSDGQRHGGETLPARHRWSLRFIGLAP